MKSRKFPSDQSDQSDPLLGVAWTLCSEDQRRGRSLPSPTSPAPPLPGAMAKTWGWMKTRDFPISGAPKQEVAKDNSMVMYIYICVYIYIYVYIHNYTHVLLMETYAKRNTGGMYSTLRETAINHRNDHSWLGFILQFLKGLYTQFLINLHWGYPLVN